VDAFMNPSPSPRDATYQGHGLGGSPKRQLNKERLVKANNYLEFQVTERDVCTVQEKTAVITSTKTNDDIINLLSFSL
jgi:hypothetical protein